MRKDLPAYPAYKESGIGLFGHLPPLWELQRLKFPAPGVTVGDVITPSKYYVDEGVPAIRSLNVMNGRLSSDDLVYFSPESNERLKKSQLREGDVVIVRSGQTGASAIVESEQEGWNCIDLIIVRRSEKLLPRYLQHLLSSAPMRA